VSLATMEDTGLGGRRRGMNREGLEDLGAR